MSFIARRGALIAGFVGGIALPAAAANNVPAPSATARAPETVYAQTCGYCHGVNVGPVIRGRKLDPAAVKAIVRTGPNAMPAFRPTEISDAELDSLALWISRSAADPKERGR